MSPAEQSDAFRRRAARTFRLAVAGLVVAGVALPAGGWWAFGWWGLAAGGVLAVPVVGGGLTAAGFLFAMTQDGG